MKKLIEYIPLTTILIIYVCVCGGVYLLAYWGTFDVDILGIVKFEDVIKSFVYPFLFSNALFFSMCMFYSFSKIEMNNAKENKKTLIDYKFSTGFLIFNIIMIGLFISIISTYKILKYNDEYWVFVGIYFFVFSSSIFETSKIVITVISNALVRFYVMCLLLLMPSISLVLAKGLALDIYNNHKIKTVSIHNTNNAQTNIVIQDTMTLKFLGFLGDKLIVSSLDNKRIIVINQSEANEVELNKQTQK